MSRSSRPSDLLGVVASRLTPGSRRALDDLRHRLVTTASRTPTTPARAVRRVLSGTLEDAVRDRVVLVTGASSGIGEATALRLGRAGATVVLVARRREQLEQVRDQIVAAGGRADVHPCDLTDLDAVAAMAAAVLADHGRVDVLVNNAGHSIRRPVHRSYDRMHDFERTMQINYYAAVKLTLALLPSMREQGRGQVVNVLSEGLLVHTPKFAAYLASKAALDEFSRCVAGEVRADGVRFTGVHMPLVRTPMIAPTKAYRGVPALRPAEAADLIVEAIVEAPYAVTPRSGHALRAAWAVAPEAVEAVIGRVAGGSRFAGSGSGSGSGAAAQAEPSPPVDDPDPDPVAARSSR
ncbi:SDR family NAD(P)-dependent oxidoreductase [Patulibacter defluvii]|uniref:SDR family NAD(P)-dependent oxidoreductase n=1 Tax=Patulibacter defluvii TaxID=3095358 RepID=UPI002A75A695|nr:SDR family NAD(P)-dependent oxidoreductase [Patulibacter sp. DM4]